jgi:hypothetical protein
MATLVAEERTRTRRRRTKRREWRALAAETGDSAQPDDALAVVINVGGDELRSAAKPVLSRQLLAGIRMVILLQLQYHVAIV